MNKAAKLRVVQLYEYILARQIYIIFYWIKYSCKFSFLIFKTLFQEVLRLVLNSGSCVYKANMHFSSPVELHISAVMLVTEKCCSANSCTTQNVGLVAQGSIWTFIQGVLSLNHKWVTIYSGRGFFRLCWEYLKVLVEDIEFGHDCLLYHPCLLTLHDHLSHSTLRGGPRLPARKRCPRQTIHSLPPPPCWGFVVEVLAEIFGKEDSLQLIHS